MRSFLRKLGPGLLFAGTAIGVSHIYQSTRAGAEYGYFLVWAVLLANLLKYPFFEFGPRYAMATGESLVTGYRRLGKPVLAIFLLITVLTVFTIQAAITGVTGALSAHIFGSALPGWGMAAIILGICTLILAVGKFKLLDQAIKVIILLLAVASIAAVAAAFGSVRTPDPNLTKIFNWQDTSILLLIGLMGWMPAPIDLSVWHSIWALEKQKISKEFDLKSSLFDFRVGYIGTAILALCFLALGAQMLYGQVAEFPPTAGSFSTLLIDIYEQALGTWAKWIIAIAALTTMFSTTLTVFDAIPRVISTSLNQLRSDPAPEKDNWLYWPLLSVLFVGTLIVLQYFAQNLRGLVDLATILSFLTAPFFAIANYMLITGKHTPKEARPGAGLRLLSALGVLFLIGFSVYYLINR